MESACAGDGGDVWKDRHVSPIGVVAGVMCWADEGSLVNNAGISVEAKNKPVGIHETPDEWFDLTMAVNARSIFLGCKHVIGQMLKQEKYESGDRGWIVNLASVFGLVGTYCNRESSRICAFQGSVDIW